MLTQKNFFEVFIARKYFDNEICHAYIIKSAFNNLLEMHNEFVTHLNMMKILLNIHSNALRLIQHKCYNLEHISTAAFNTFRVLIQILL